MASNTRMMIDCVHCVIPLCSWFDTTSRLEHHICMNHLHWMPWGCEICHLHFPTEKSVLNHGIQDHNTQLEVCMRFVASWSSCNTLNVRGYLFIPQQGKMAIENEISKFSAVDRILGLICSTFLFTIDHF